MASFWWQHEIKRIGPKRPDRLEDAGRLISNGGCGSIRTRSNETGSSQIPCPSQNLGTSEYGSSGTYLKNLKFVFARNLDEIQWEDTQYQPLKWREWTSFMLTVEHHCLFFCQVQCSCSTAWEKWTQDLLLWLLQWFLAPIKATSRILHLKHH